jgi:predicted metalloprotease
MTKIRSRDASRIQDRRGQGGGFGGLGDLLNGGLGGGRGGGGGLPIPGGLLKGGGGLIGLLLIAAMFFLPKLLGGASSTGVGQGASDGAGQATGSDEETCSSDLERQICGATNDVADYWVEQLPVSFGVDYAETQTVFFSGSTNTGCGTASSQTGPFYCPTDNLVYFDLEFLTQLQEMFGATGDLAAQYIVAHEYGHHVQNVLGINAQMQQAQQQDPGRANQYSIALELQADCFAGAWARDASDRGLFDDPTEVEEALNAAAAVGDDRIQQQTQGRVDPESWTHGSSEQRVSWFRRGFDTADPERCTTFSEIL